MDSKLSPIAVGISVGLTAGLLFMMAFVSYIYRLADAQSGIALALSPCYALWFGGSVGAIAAAWKLLSKGSSAGIPLMVVGILGLATIVIFLASEHYQATHPTVYPPYREPTP